MVFRARDQHRFCIVAAQAGTRPRCRGCPVLLRHGRDSAGVLFNVATSGPVPARLVADDSWFSGGFMGTFPSRRSPLPHPLLPSLFLSVLQIPIIIPCHRVICSSGQTGNYGGGNLMKEWLLSHEKLQKEKLAY